MRVIEPVFSRTEYPRFLKMTVAVRDSESCVVFPISPADFEGMRFLAAKLFLTHAFPASAESAPECGQFTVYLEDLKITPGGDKIGDVAVGHVTVFSEDGQVVGMQNVTTLIAPGASEGKTQLIVNAYLKVGSNQLIYSGSYPAPSSPDTVPHFETQLAVVGGTGVFKSASGQVNFFKKVLKKKIFSLMLWF